MNSIAALQDVRLHLGLDASDTADDNRLVAALYAASATIEQRTGRNFSPYIATLDHIPNTPQEILLRDDVLEIDSITDSDGTVIPLADVTREGAVLTLTGARFFAGVSSTARVQIQGLWGYHPQPAIMWKDSETTTATDTNTSTSTLYVQSITLPDGNPRFSAGQLLKIGDEFLRVVSVDIALNAVYVVRGARGSTVSIHLDGSSIQIFQPAPAARSLCVRWAAWLYRSADRLPEPLPEALLDMLHSLQRLSVQA